MSAGQLAPGNRLLRLARSSIGAKMVVSVTGLLLFGFVTAHLAGNLLLLAGPDALNEYAHWMHTHPQAVWPMRLLLLGVFTLHVGTAVRLARQNRAARPVPYAFDATVQATWASRHMVLSGLVLLAFVIYHLLHFTLHVVPTGEIEGVGGRLDVYGMVVRAFRSPAVALGYVAAQALLGVHLFHGSRSLFQSAGLRFHALRRAALALGLSVAAGNILLPLSVLLGLVGNR